MNFTKNLFQLIKNIRHSNAIIKFSSSASAIEKYGRSAKLSVPLIKEVIDYPKPVIHKDFKLSRRLANDWASQYWDEKITKIMLADDWPYFLSFVWAHFPFDLFLDQIKFGLLFITVDTIVENDYQASHRESAVKIMKKVFKKLLINGNNKWESFADEVKQMDSIQKMMLDFSLMMVNKYNADPKAIVDTLSKYITNDVSIKKDVNYCVSFNQFMSDRRKSFLSEEGVLILMYVAGFRDFTLAKQLYWTPEFQRLVTVFEAVVCLANEIRSLPVELKRNDHWGNGVTVLAREKDISLQEGVELMFKLLDDKITEFQTISWRLVYCSNLVRVHPNLRQLIEIGLANVIYGLIYYNDFIGKYKTDDSGTVYEHDVQTGNRIDKALIYNRVKNKKL